MIIILDFEGVVAACLAALQVFFDVSGSGYILFFHFLSPPVIVLNSLLGEEGTNDSVDLFEKAHEMAVGSRCGSLSSNINLSILLRTRIGLCRLSILDATKLWSWVTRASENYSGDNNEETTCVQTPSMTSSKTNAPSHKRAADDTSVAKSTCPGVSIRLMVNVCGGPPEMRRT